MNRNPNISSRRVLTVLANEFNECSAAAATFKLLEHDAYRPNALSASAVLEVTKNLFRDGRDFTLTMVPAEYNGQNFEWRKMEVL